jgi:Tol biopolymer transport system component
MYLFLRRLCAVILIALVIAPVLTISPASAQGTCGTAPAPRMTIGQQGRIVVSDGTGNNLRDTFATTGTVLGVLADGEVFNVISGPQCAENYWWWQVRRWDGQTGWTVEGVTGEYFIEPWPIVGAKLTTGPRPDLPNTLLAFTSAGADNIHRPVVMNVAGTAMAALGTLAITPTAAEGDLAWTPDGTRLAISDHNDLYVVNADGTNLVNVTNSPTSVEYWPTWSPDGTRLAFASTPQGTGTTADIYSLSLVGGTLIPLTNTPGVDTEPDWSPDGTRLVFVSDRDGNRELYTMSAADGANPFRLTINSTLDSDPVWSPDGRQIAFTSTQPDGRIDVYVINADGSGLIPLTADGKSYHSLTWSPDNQRVAFVGASPTTPGAEDLFSVRRDGTDRMQYTLGAGQIAGVSWSPDGLWIAFASSLSGNFDLYAIRASGINLVNLTNTAAANDTRPVWQPRTATGTVITAQGTPIATAPAVNPGSQDLLLIYNTTAPAFTLQNVSGKTVNLTPLTFTGGGLTVPASVWTEYTASPLENFKAVGCLMIWPFGIAEQPAPPECGDARQGWIENARYIFWTQGSFTVSYNGAVVATCNTADGRCAVDLP